MEQSIGGRRGFVLFGAPGGAVFRLLFLFIIRLELSTEQGAGPFFLGCLRVGRASYFLFLTSYFLLSLPFPMTNRRWQQFFYGTIHRRETLLRVIRGHLEALCSVCFFTV